jgi:tetratricopeptide (TPR) repeat protein
VTGCDIGGLAAGMHRALAVSLIVVVVAGAASSVQGQDALPFGVPVAGDTMNPGSETHIVRQQNVLPAAFPHRVVELLSSGSAGGDLNGRLAWSVVPPVTAEGGQWSVELVAEVSASSLLHGHREEEFRVGVFGYVLSSDGSLVDHISQLSTFRSPWAEGTREPAGLRVIHRFDLHPGSYSIRLVIEDSVSQRYSLIARELVVPEYRPESPILLPPLVEEVSDGWVILKTFEESATAAAVATDGGRSFYPSSRVFVARGQSPEVVFAGLGWGANVRSTARLVDENGVDRAALTVRKEERSHREGRDLLLFRTSLDYEAPGPGHFNLLISVEDPVSGASVTGTLAVQILDGNSRTLLASTSQEEGLPEASRVELQTRQIGSVSAGTVALLLSGQRGGEIAGSLIWTLSPQTVDDGSSEVLVFVDVDGRTLLGEDPDSRLDVGFFGYVFSDEGRLVAHLAQGLNLDLRDYEEVLRARGLKFAGRFPLQPGAYFARLLVRNQNNGRVYLTQARIDVPSGDDERVLLPPLFQEEDGGWIVARQDNLAAGRIGVDLSDLTVLPASRVVVETLEPAELFLGGSGWDDGSPIMARVADSQGRQLAEPVLTIERQIGSPDGTIRFFRGTLDPLDLPPGFYTLEVILDDELTGASLSRYVPLAVVLTRGPLVLEAGISGQPIDRLVPEIVIPATTLTEDEFAALYAEALRRLGEGDRYGARDAVVEAERMALGAGGQRQMTMIAKVERRVVRGLAAIDPGVLRPISLLHRDVFRQHLAFGSNQLADISWPLAADLAVQVSDEGRSNGGKDFAETLLVSLAADLVRSAAVRSAIEVLDRAIDVAPDDPAALLALGATYERSGRYEEAIEPFRNLVYAHPGNAEGVLRLGINLSRDGKTEEAESRFRELISDSAPTWITVIAYQELARLLPPSEAEAVLRQGVERYPDNQALGVQLAFLLDVRGQRESAAALVEDLCRRGRAPVTSPRVRYPAWPSLGIEERIGILEGETEPLLSALVTALEAMAPTTEAEGNPA